MPILASALLLLTLPVRAVGGEDDEKAASTLGPLVELLGQVDDADFQLDLLKGMRQGLKGRRQAALPPGWPQVYARLAKSPSQKVRDEARLLAVLFGDPKALAALRTTLMDSQAPEAQRRTALESLVERRVEDLPPLLHKLLADRALRRSALRGLGAFDDEGTPQAILAIYARLDAAEKQDAIVTLASRPAYALALLDAVGRGAVSRTDVSAYVARQLGELGDEHVTARLREVWGEIRAASAEKKQTIARYKALLTDKLLAKADVVNGRRIFSRTCMQCHKLYGQGATIGPDLTGSNRANLDYVLENAVDPSALIGKDYQLTTVLTDAGRVLSGIVVGENESTLTLQTVNERIVLDKTEIDQRRLSPLSMMPEGQLDKLQPDELRDLVGYLRSTQQVPLPEGEQPQVAAGE